MASVQLGVIIDIRDLSFKIRNAEYNPRKVNAIVLRFRYPRGTALLYTSGRVVVSGCKSEEDSRICSKKVAKIVSKSGYNAGYSNYTIENMICSGDVRFPIRLEMLASEHRADTSYEPELSPGLTYRMHEPKVSMIIYVSGKIVFSGGRSRDMVRDAYERIYPLLYTFQC